MDSDRRPEAEHLVTESPWTIGPDPEGKEAPIPFVPSMRERYALMRMHATGGIGRVWLARDDHLGREVALKELRDDKAQNPAAWAWFLQEARVTGQLQHPGVVPVYELSRRPENRQPFYTMRFVQGRTLADAAGDYQQKRSKGQAGPLELRALLNAFVTICQTVAYAHARGVVHRDLKGDNIVLGDFGEVLVLDWGLAKIVSQPGDTSDAPPVQGAEEGTRQETVQGQVLGTPSHMAPEQAAGRPDLIGPATDVYGLGAVLFEILTGRPPFTGAPTELILLQVRETSPPRPRQLSPGIPNALEAICLRALAKAPADRHASARELGDEVQRWLADEPLLSYREPLVARLGRWARRHKPAVTGAAALLLTAVVALTVSTFLIGRAKTRADANYRLAREAVDRFHTLVSENQLLNKPGLQPLRKELLEAAGEFYEKLMDQPGQAAMVQGDLAWARYRLAHITSQLSSKSKAAESFQEALAAFAQLAREYPDRTEYQGGQAECLNKLGGIYHEIGDPERAKETYNEARAILEALTQQQADNAHFRSELAKCLGNLGTLYYTNHESRQAEEAFLAALQAFTRLTQDYPQAQDYQGDLARTYSNLGALYRDLDRPSEAEHAHQQGLEIRKRLAQDHPEDVDLQRSLAVSYLNLGVWYQDAKQLNKALEVSEQALTIFQKLVRDNPAVLNYQSELAMCANNVGVLYRSVDKLEPAEQAHQQASKLMAALVRDHPQVVDYQIELAQGNMHLGAVYLAMQRQEAAQAVLGQAVEQFQRLVRDHPEEMEYQLGAGESSAQFGTLLLEADHPEAALPYLNQSVKALEVVLAQELLRAQAKPLLGQALAKRAESWTALQAYAQAVADWDRAIPFSDEDEATILRLARATTLAYWGKHAEAAAEGQKAQKQATQSAEGLYQLGLLYAACSSAAGSDPALAKTDRERLTEEHAARAVACLRQAAALDFFKKPANRGRLDKDKTLATLRVRRDFQELQASLKH